MLQATAGCQMYTSSLNTRAAGVGVKIPREPMCISHQWTDAEEIKDVEARGQGG